MFNSIFNLNFDIQLKDLKFFTEFFFIKYRHDFSDYHQIKIFFAKIVFDIYIYSSLIPVLEVIIFLKIIFVDLKISFNQEINLKLFICNNK